MRIICHCLLLWYSFGPQEAEVHPHVLNKTESIQLQLHLPCEHALYVPCVQSAWRNNNSPGRKHDCCSSYLEHGVVAHFSPLWPTWVLQQQTLKKLSWRNETKINDERWPFFTFFIPRENYLDQTSIEWIIQTFKEKRLKNSENAVLFFLTGLSGLP